MSWMSTETAAQAIEDQCTVNSNHGYFRGEILPTGLFSTLEKLQDTALTLGK